MKRALVAVLLMGVCGVTGAQKLSPRWEELTAGDFVKAIQQSRGVCVLPFGILEKHGPSGPLGTDLIDVRHETMQAVESEYAVVFPQYYFGQIAEARQQPGTVAYSSRIQLELLQATTDEMARNGCRKVMIVNGHGGNNAMLEYFAQVQLDSPKDYVVYVVRYGDASAAAPAAAPSKPGVDGHAGEDEISVVMASRPDLAHPERGSSESGADQDRLKLPDDVYTGIWWYAKFPNHYEGDASGATAARGKALVAARAESIAKAIRAVKDDEVAPRLQKEFFDAARHPLDTKQ